MTRFALVIGNNHPERADQERLHYADDDALAVHDLLRNAGVRSRLFVAFDRSSQRMARQRVEPVSAEPPRWQSISAALSMMRQQMQREREHGRRSEFLLFYSGHGDVAEGEGYVVLQDRRLTRALLYQLLASLPTARNHVVIDACKSYFLAFAKGPGGRRQSYSRSFAPKQVPSLLANTGFVLSTSSDRDSHEWERFQGGVFSYEVRSALRGAADADRDHQVTYEELGAFLRIANAAVTNPRFRPDFVVYPPRDASPPFRVNLLDWSHRPPSLLVDMERPGHLYVEDAAGMRLLDAHPTPGSAIALYLPEGRPIFIQSSAGGSEYAVEDSTTTARLSGLVPRSPRTMRKGALHLAFERLFSLPFDATHVAMFRSLLARNRGPAIWVERAPALDFGEQARPHALINHVAGWTAIATTAAGIGLVIWAAERSDRANESSQADRIDLNRTVRALNISSIVLFSAAGAAGLTWLLTELWSR